MYNFEDYPEGYADDIADDMISQFGKDRFMCECCGKDINTRKIHDAVNIATVMGHVFCSEDCLIEATLDDDQIEEIKKARKTND